MLGDPLPASSLGHVLKAVVSGEDDLLSIIPMREEEKEGKERDVLRADETKKGVTERTVTSSPGFEYFPYGKTGFRHGVLGQCLLLAIMDVLQTVEEDDSFERSLHDIQTVFDDVSLQ